MEKKVITLGLFVVLGIVVGVGIVKKQIQEPLLKEVLQRQDALIESQQRLEHNMGSGQIAGDLGIVSQVTIRSLESRIAALETQLNGIQKLIDQAKAAQQGPPPEDFSKVYDIPLDHSPVKGNKNAPVTIVEFVDFQCPFCARFHSPLVETLEAYPDKVNYVLKNFPLSFHPEARPAAKAAFAAGVQGKYWEMADRILENGKNLSMQKYKEIAEEIGLDMEQFLEDYEKKDAQWEDYIQKDLALGGQVNVRGTPTFYINGRKTNARDVAGFKKEIDSILNGQQ